jgi:UDP:flavonoid glycosyltransferase YjiC (YdhE family)
VRDNHEENAGLGDLREALGDKLTQAAREEMARLRAEAAGEARAAKVLERLARALARKRREGPNPK